MAKKKSVCRVATVLGLALIFGACDQRSETSESAPSVASSPAPDPAVPPPAGSEQGATPVPHKSAGDPSQSSRQ